MTHKIANILSVMSGAVDIIHCSYYVHGPWRDRKNFCCFICVIIVGLTRCYKPRFFTFIFATVSAEF